MNGIYSYEERLRNPGKSLIDWEYLTNHPEAKFAIWQKYLFDAIFHHEVDQKLVSDPIFRQNFKTLFRPNIDNYKKGR